MVKKLEIENWQLPLWDLFSRLQSAGFPLGIGEYKLLIAALSELEEEEIKDSKTLKRLCCALWVKSNSDKLRFEAYFYQHFPLLEDNESAVNEEISSQTNIFKDYFIRLVCYFNSLSLGQKSLLMLGTLGLLILGTWGGIKCVEVVKLNFQKTPSSQTTTPEGNNQSQTNGQPPTDNQTPSNNQTSTNGETETNNQTEDVAIPILQPLNPLYLVLLLIWAASGIIYWWQWYIQKRKTKTPVLSKNSQIIAILPSQLTPDYFPLTPRQMKQIWRGARCLVRAGCPQELDVKATVAETSRQGFLLKPVLIPRRVNRTQLLLLIDMEGSMIPFQTLSFQLVQTAYESGRFHRSWVYYFHNYPLQYLYQDSFCLKAQKISELLVEIHPQYTGVLIVSDGGALRGHFNQMRLEETKNFIDQLKQHTHKLSWLNPLPSFRWHNTTAEAIAKEVSMFELNRQGFEEAIASWRKS